MAHPCRALRHGTIKPHCCDDRSNPPAGFAGFDADRDREVCLAQAGRTEEHDVLSASDERCGRQVREGVAGGARDVAEGEVLHGFGLREVRAGDA